MLTVLHTLLCFLVAPNATVRAVTAIVITAHEITLTWMELERCIDRNGIITRFVIRYGGLEDNTLSEVYEHTLRDLTPITNYSIEIAAETVAVGPFSDPITVQTLEDGMLK